MENNIVKFTPRKLAAAIPYAPVSTSQMEREALDNYQTFINIIKANIEILNDIDQAWMILNLGPFELNGKPEIQEFCAMFVQAWLSEFLKELEHPARTDSYLNSYLVGELTSAMSMMDADHLTTINLWTEDDVVSIMLARTWDLWGMVNLFRNGVSVWEALRNTLADRGYTNKDMFHWVEEN